MTVSTDTDRFRALDLGVEDWTWFYELAFWLSPRDEDVDHFDYVPAAQATLASLLDDDLVEVAEFDTQSGVYTPLDGTAARRVIADREAWRTAADLSEQGSNVLFAFGATEAGCEAYFGAPPKGAG